MATTNQDFTKIRIAESIMPRIFQHGDDLEIFISDCNRYFDVCGLETANRNMMVKCLIQRDILSIYEAVEEKGQGFENKLREAFQKPTSLIDDFLEIYNYEKEAESATIFFDKVEKMVKKLLSHRWAEDELVSYFLIHCIKDKDTKKEIRMRDAKNVEEIKSVIKKLDAINTEISEHAAIQRKDTFANVVKKRQEFNDRQRHVERRDYQRPVFKPREEAQTVTKRMITCWNCGQTGHSSRECQNRRIQTCYTCRREGHISRDCPNMRKLKPFCWGCKEEGHIRDECPNIYCSSCSRRGHLKFQCRNQTRGPEYQINRGSVYTRQNRDGRNEYSSSSRFDRRPVYQNANRLAAMTSGDDAMQERNQDEADDAMIGDDYPNGRAPSLDGMIGAMQ